jgi:hypothetical protein
MMEIDIGRNPVWTGFDPEGCFMKMSIFLEHMLLFNVIGDDYFFCLQ